MKKLFTLLALVITLITNAQAPQGFNYQATVRNSAGDLIVNQNVYFKFNLMLNSASSVPVFSETHYTPTDDLGQVNIVIGQGTATVGNFSTINWGNGNYYLGIELNTGSGYVAMGTTQLLSVPYALYANSAGSSQSQGKPSIYLTGDITNAEAAARIASQLGPVTENIYIQNTTQLTTVDLSAMEYAADINIENNNVLTSINLSGLKDCYSDLEIYSNPLLTTVSFPALTNSRYINISNNPLLTTVSFPDLTNNRNIDLNNNALSIATINSLLNKMLSVLPSTGKYILLSGQNPPAPPTGQGLIDKQTLIDTGNQVFTDFDTTFELDANDFQGTIANGEVVVLNANTVYKLTGALIVGDQATLTIPAGTVIEAIGGTSSYIAVAQGGTLNVNGTATNPVIMTSGNAVKAPGDWGGLVICGRAKTNKGGSTGQTAISEVGDLTYGGDEDTDSSGVIRYLRVEYTGAAYNPTKEFNGVSLFGVGSGTVFEYIQAYKSGDDGIEFFGGAVNAKYLVALHSEDDAVDFADGFSGSIEYVFIKDVAKAGVEGSNNGDNSAAMPTTNATLKNFTIIKGALAGSEHGMYIKEGGGKWNCQNIYIDGFTKGIKIKNSTEDPAANGFVDAGYVTFNPIYFGASITIESEYAGTNTTYLTIGANTGAGNSGNAPTWTTGWTTGL
jgi:hypothetical protein